MRKIVLFVLICAMLSLSPLFADNGDKHVMIFTNYNTPYNNELMDAHIGLGAAFRFWGVFTANATMFTDIVPGGENIFNIEKFEPLGLFSTGFGMRIPLGDDLRGVLDWQKYYRGLGSDDGVYPFSKSWKLGLALDLSDSFAIEVYKRTLYSFSEEALSADDSVLNGTPPEDGVEIVGVGFTFYL